ncbi:hypothetical protein [Methylomonas sp. AM2-LC]|uniref:hypothetical protein n=1 Tax=Methylomonas sp. AM2-LC TaxID=3153301 RepID=UPI003266EAEC
MQLQIKSLALVAAILSAATLLPAQEAAAAAALVKNVEQPGRLPYQQTVQFNSIIGNCNTFSGNTNACLVSFNAVPAGKRLVVEHVTLLIATTGGAPNLVAFGEDLSTNTGIVAVIKPDFSAGINISGSTFWNLDREARVYYEPGTTPKIKILVPGSIVGFDSSATVHGYLIDAN